MNPVLKTLLSSSIFANLAGGLFGPIYAIFVEKIGGDILGAASAWSIYMIVTGLFIIIISRYFDSQLKKENLVVFGYFVQTIGFFSYLLVDDSLKLFLVQAILGISLAIINSPWDAIYSLALDKTKEVKEWSIWEGATAIVRGIAALIGGVIAFKFGFQTLFILMGFLGLASTIISLKLIKLPKPKTA